MCPVKCVLKTAGMTMIPIERNEVVLMRPMNEWRVCMDFHKMNVWTNKDHFSALDGSNVIHTSRQRVVLLSCLLIGLQ